MPNPMLKLLLASALCVGGAAMAADLPVVQLTLEEPPVHAVGNPSAAGPADDHRSHQRRRDRRRVRDAATRNRESDPGRRHRPGAAPPARARKYTFIGEYHEATAHGTIVVDPPAAK